MKVKNEVESRLSSSNHKLETRISSLIRAFPTRMDAARVADVSTDMLNRYMAGKSQPSFAPIARMAINRGVRLEWIWTGEGPMRAGDQRAPGEIDWELLQNVIGAVDKMLSRQGRRVTSAAKADLTRRIYLYYKEGAGQESDATRDMAMVMDIVQAALEAGVNRGETIDRGDL